MEHDLSKKKKKKHPMGHEEEIQQENAAPQHPPVPQGQCLHCDHNYTNARGLAAHNRNRHKKIINNECGICGNVFDTHQPIFNSIGRGGIRTHEASVAGVEDDVMDIDDEAVMLEAAMFGGIPEGSGYRLPFAPHHLMQNGLNRVMDRYNQRMPRPPSPSLTAKRLLQEQQDDEYFASLQAGREKELKAKEEAEAALAERRKEEQLRKKLEDEQGIVYLKLFIIILSSSAAYTILDYPHCLLPEKFKEIDRQLAAKDASLPQEPTSDDEIAITLLVRLPDGSRRGRRFLKSDRLQYLFDFIDIGKGVKPGMYRLVMLIVGEAISSTSF